MPLLNSRILALTTIQSAITFSRKAEDWTYLFQKKNHVVAAIDFGTSFSGYAWAYEYDPFTVYTKEWLGANMTSGTEKAPTTVRLLLCIVSTGSTTKNLCDFAMC